MFHINGEEWRVVYVAPSHPKLIRSDGSVSIGACDDDTKTIYISYETPRHKLKKSAVPRNNSCGNVQL